MGLSSNYKAIDLTYFQVDLDTDAFVLVNFDK